MTAQSTSIDLLPQEEWERGTFGKILKWALTIGRHIVIFTELIVIIAFLSRFKLDRDMTDLTDKIKQKQAIVQSSQQFENKFRFLQKELETIKELKAKQLEADLVVAELGSKIPVDVYLSDFSVSKGEVSMNALALSEGGLATFIRNLKSSSKFENLVLAQVSSGSEKEIGIKFQLRGDLIPEKKKE